MQLGLLLYIGLCFNSLTSALPSSSFWLLKSPEVYFLPFSFVCFVSSLLSSLLRNGSTGVLQQVAIACWWCGHLKKERDENVSMRVVRIPTHMLNRQYQTGLYVGPTAIPDISHLNTSF